MVTATFKKRLVKHRVDIESIIPVDSMGIPILHQIKMGDIIQDARYDYLQYCVQSLSTSTVILVEIPYTNLVSEAYINYNAVILNPISS